VLGRPAAGGSRREGVLDGRPVRGSIVEGSPSAGAGVDVGRPVRGSMGAAVGSPVRGSVRGCVEVSPVRGSTVVDGAEGGAGVSTGEDGEPGDGESGEDSEPGGSAGDDGLGRAPGSGDPVCASAGAATRRTVPKAKISGWVTCVLLNDRVS
jgi:hypothetical protein